MRSAPHPQEAPHFRPLQSQTIQEAQAAEEGPGHCLQGAPPAELSHPEDIETLPVTELRLKPAHVSVGTAPGAIAILHEPDAVLGETVVPPHWI